MPLDCSQQPDQWPQRPVVDRDRVAQAMQKKLGRPITTQEYTDCWNSLTKWMGKDDFITEWVEVVP